MTLGAIRFGSVNFMNIRTRGFAVPSTAHELAYGPVKTLPETHDTFAEINVEDDHAKRNRVFFNNTLIGTSERARELTLSLAKNQLTREQIQSGLMQILSPESSDLTPPEGDDKQKLEAFMSESDVFKTALAENSNFEIDGVNGFAAMGTFR